MTWRVTEATWGGETDYVIVAWGETGWPRYKILVERRAFGSVDITCGVIERPGSVGLELAHLPDNALGPLAWLLLRRGDAPVTPGSRTFSEGSVHATSGASLVEMVQTAVALQQAGSYWDGMDDWVVPWTQGWRGDHYVAAATREGRDGTALAQGELVLRRLLERFGMSGEQFTTEVVHYVEQTEDGPGVE